MFKRFFIYFTALLIFAAIVSGCASDDPPKPTTFAGTWSEEGGNGSKLVALIEDDIEVTLVSGSGNRYLYWKGTWTCANDISDDLDQCVSDADTEALAMSIMGSEEKHMTFKYSFGTLAFEFRAFEMAKTAHLTKE